MRTIRPSICLLLFNFSAVSCTSPRLSTTGTTTPQHAVGEVTRDEFAVSNQPLDVLLSLPAWLFEADRATIQAMHARKGSHPPTQAQNTTINFIGDGAQASLDVTVLRPGSPGAGLLVAVTQHPVAGYGRKERFVLLRLKHGWKIIERTEI